MTSFNERSGASSSEGLLIPSGGSMKYYVEVISNLANFNFNVEVESRSRSSIYIQYGCTI